MDPLAAISPGEGTSSNPLLVPPSRDDDDKLKDLKVRVLGYHRRDKDERVIKFRSVEHDQVRHIIAKPFTPARNQRWWNPSLNLGHLKNLPLELLIQIFLELDVQSIFNLLHVSVSTRQAVTFMVQWRAVSTHALDTLLAILRTQAAQSTSLTGLYKRMINNWCEKCGLYGGFLFIPRVMRYCAKCTGEPYIFPIVTLNSVAKRNKVPLAALRQHVDVLKTIPGWYGEAEYPHMRPVHIVSAGQALDALMIIKGRDSDEVHKLLGELVAYAVPGTLKHAEYRCTTVIPTYDPVRATSYTGLCCRACAAEGLRSLGRVQPSQKLPRKVESTFSCPQFLKHIANCEGAQQMWKASEGGTKDVSHLESRFSINGGFNPIRMTPDRAWAF
jgi:hypothetical protein